MVINSSLLPVNVLERSVEAINREISKKREAIAKAQQHVDDLNDEVVTVRHSVSRSSAELTKIRTQIANNKQYIENNERKYVMMMVMVMMLRLEEAFKAVAEAKKRWEDHVNNQKSAGEMATEADAQLKMIEAELKTSGQFVDAQKNALYKKTQESIKLKEIELALTAEINGIRAATKNYSRYEYCHHHHHHQYTAQARCTSIKTEGITV